MLSGILTRGGTILGTSRVKVHKVDMGDGSKIDMRPMIQQVIEQHDMAALVCLGGGGTMKNALRLHKVGIPVVALPKTIDNDVVHTDTTFGFDTALGIATEAIDRLHSTAHSHHRIMVTEIMGHNTGWLTLGSGWPAEPTPSSSPRSPTGWSRWPSRSCSARRPDRTSRSWRSPRERCPQKDKTRHDEMRAAIDAWTTTATTPTCGPSSTPSTTPRHARPRIWPPASRS
jgi:6-phosphofructokinase